MDGFQYLNGDLQFISHAEGYINFAQNPGLQEFNKFTYIYNYMDHLGNVRLSYAENPKNLGNLVILEENNYYPFGLQHAGYNKDTKEISFEDYLGLTNEDLQNISEDDLLSVVPVIKNKYKYKYNGKELQEELGLDWYDYGARNYDSSLGRWMNVDPLADKYPSYSPYVYTLNNPIIFTDPTGMEPEPPRVLLVFYHGGPFGDGSIYKNIDLKQQRGTGKIYQNTLRYAKANGYDVKGAVIAPGATQDPGVRTGKKFLEDNYKAGDKVIIYGYSYGGDNAVNLSEAAEELGIPVDLLVTVDSSDGLGRGLTVDTSVPDNVDTAYNFYQTSASGGSSRSGSDSDNPNSSENSSSDGSSNSMGSRGFPHLSEGTAKVNNIKITGKGVTHGNIQTKAETNIQNRINTRLDGYE